MKPRDKRIFYIVDSSLVVASQFIAAFKIIWKIIDKWQENLFSKMLKIKCNIEELETSKIEAQLLESVNSKKKRLCVPCL